MVSCTELRKFRQIFNQRQLELKQSFRTLVFHIRSLKTLSIISNNVDEELMITRWLFDEKKTIAINLPFSNKNEHFSKKFCGKLEFYTNGKVKHNIIWATKKSHYLKLKITLNILVVLFTKEFVVVEIITQVKPSEMQ